MEHHLSERIAALRRSRGLTQEQLGQLVGVSAQAVSKWEKGGAPDVELLPVLADRLGVTIDGLFGRADAQVGDLSRELSRWLGMMPQEERLGRLFRLLADVFPTIVLQSNAFGESLGALYGESCYLQGVAPEGEKPAWLRAIIVVEEGLALGVLSKEFPLYLLMPEPPRGWAAHFAPTEDYRQLFSALATAGSLECLLYLYAQKQRFYTAAAVARRTGLDAQTVEHAFEALTACHLLNRRELEMEEGSVFVYALHDNHAIVPFLCLARWLCEADDVWNCGWDTRTRPILAPPHGKEAERDAQA